MDSPEEDASQVIEDACKDFGTSIVDRIYDIAENEPGVRLEMFWKISVMMLFVSIREPLAIR